FTYKANNGTDDSNTVAVTLTVTAVNDPPVVTMTPAALAYAEASGAVAAAARLTVADPDSATLAGATMTIASNYANGEDVLAFTAQSGITGVWNPAAGVLT